MSGRKLLINSNRTYLIEKNRTVSEYLGLNEFLSDKNKKSEKVDIILSNDLEFVKVFLINSKDRNRDYISEFVDSKIEEDFGMLNVKKSIARVDSEKYLVTAIDEAKFSIKEIQKRVKLNSVQIEDIQLIDSVQTENSTIVNINDKNISIINISNTIDSYFNRAIDFNLKDIDLKSLDIEKNSVLNSEKFVEFVASISNLVDFFNEKVKYKNSVILFSNNKIADFLNYMTKFYGFNFNKYIGLSEKINYL